MATSRRGEQLTEAQRRQQLALRASFLTEFLRLWPLLAPDRLEDTAGQWLRLVLQLVTDHRSRSAESARIYYSQFRSAETGSLTLVPEPRLPWDDMNRAARSSLAVTGPVNVRARIQRGEDPVEAARAALPEVSAAAGRHVLAGGRFTVVAAAEEDRTAVGWARITDGDPCFWCAMLASRGFAYRSEKTALFKANGIDRYHDGCGCTVEASFDEDAPLPGLNQEFSDLWAETTGGYSGPAAVRAFRRAYEARQRASRAS